MHELSVAQALVEQLRIVAQEQGVSAIRAVSLDVGLLSGVDPHALEGAFPIASAGTLADGAVLRLNIIPSRILCKECGEASEPEYPFIICSLCDSTSVDIIAGRELNITGIEIPRPESNITSA